MILGAFFREERIAQNISFTCAYTELNINKGYYNDFENGKRSISSKYYPLLNDYFDVQFNFDENLYHEMNQYLQKIYLDYIQINLNSYEQSLNELLSFKDKYDTSYAHFLYHLGLCFLLTLNDCNEECAKEIRLIEPYQATLTPFQQLIFLIAKILHYSEFDDLEKVNTCCQQARELANESHDLEALALIDFLEARLLNYLGYAKRGFILIHRSLKYFSNTRFHVRTLNCELTLVSSLITLQEYEDAEQLLLSLQAEYATLLPAKKLLFTTKLGWCYLQSNQLEKALTYFDEALTHPEVDPFNFLNKALCLFRLKRYDDCLHFMKEIKTPNPLIQHFLQLLEMIITNQSHIHSFGIQCLEECDQQHDLDTKGLLLETLIQADPRHQNDYLILYSECLGYQYDPSKRKKTR